MNLEIRRFSGSSELEDRVQRAVPRRAGRGHRAFNEMRKFRTLPLTTTIVDSSRCLEWTLRLVNTSSTARRVCAHFEKTGSGLAVPQNSDSGISSSIDYGCAWHRGRFWSDWSRVATGGIQSRRPSTRLHAAMATYPYLDPPLSRPHLSLHPQPSDPEMMRSTTRTRTDVPVDFCNFRNFRLNGSVLRKSQDGLSIPTEVRKICLSVVLNSSIFLLFKSSNTHRFALPFAIQESNSDPFNAKLTFKLSFDEFVQYSAFPFDHSSPTSKLERVLTSAPSRFFLPFVLVLDTETMSLLYTPNTEPLPPFDSVRKVGEIYIAAVYLHHLPSSTQVPPQKLSSTSEFGAVSVSCQDWLNNQRWLACRDWVDLVQLIIGSLNGIASTSYSSITVRFRIHRVANELRYDKLLTWSRRVAATSSRRECARPSISRGVRASPKSYPRANRQRAGPLQHRVDVRRNDVGGIARRRAVGRNCLKGRVWKAELRRRECGKAGERVVDVGGDAGRRRQGDVGTLWAGRAVIATVGVEGVGRERRSGRRGSGGLSAEDDAWGSSRESSVCKCGRSGVDVGVGMRWVLWARWEAVGELGVERMKRNSEGGTQPRHGGGERRKSAVRHHGNLTIP
ncbi:hypothetical protein R3P38DRAFT_2800292 [Favolaschia claudopus]|uniref:Uncharacterized protein n=1 Tax=Favolaschia claudopus TaxID=2862362 RepID=A0AAV9ZYU8_9AGAR